jgi:hypothetical protein
MSERVTTQMFGWGLSGILLTMLVLNAIAGETTLVGGLFHFAALARAIKNVALSRRGVVLVVVAIPMTPFLDDNNFAVIAIAEPAAIVVTVAVTSFDFNLGVLRLRWRRSERHSQPDSRHCGDC